MHFLRSRTALLALGGLLVVVVALGGTLAVLNASPTPTPTPSPSPTASPSPSPSPSPTPTPSPTPSPSPSPTPTPSPTPEARCPMNGQRVADPSLAERVPMLVQIENNPIARPPSGLNFADLVIEAPVEGDTTRFGAIFMCTQPVGVAVGPVRSARYFNIDYWQQLRVLTFHFGGAGKVIARFDNNSMPYLNGLSGAYPFFYRAGPWAAPHDVYLDVDTARAAIEPGGPQAALGAAAGDVRAPFAFADDVTLPAGRRVGTISLQTASFWWFGWEWDANSGTWLRTDAGAPNFDKLTGERISARTIVVQVVEQDVLVGENDPGGYPRRYQHLVGSGTGRLYINGRGYDLEWSRENKYARTSWTFADTGEPLVLPPGRVWWEIVPVGSAIGED